MDQSSDNAIFIAADHRGFEQKQILSRDLAIAGHEVHDLGPDEFVADDDFNDAAARVCQKVLEDPKNARGVIICGSAIGVAMQANRFKGIRAVAAYKEGLAKLGRQHEDANVLCLSADFVDPAENLKIIKIFLETAAFTDEKYLRRERKLDEINLEEEQ